MTMRRSMASGVVATVLAAALLAGCSGSGDGDETSTDASTETSQTQDADAPSPDASESEEAIEPAEHQEIKVDEKKTHSDQDAAYTMTVNKAVINDYYVEVEIRLVNDGTKEFMAWYGSSNSSAPRLFDDRGREFEFQPQAGVEGKSFYLRGGEGVDAVLVFAGRVDPTAKALTLSFDKINPIWNQVEFTIPVKGS